jgi:branched-chain amino acid transport system substrate-binding protein
MNARYVVTTVTAIWLVATPSMVGTAFADDRPGNVVVLGGTLALSGRNAEPGGRFLNAWKLYVDELNQRGGLLGHQVELRILD